MTDKQDLFTHVYIQQSLMQLHFRRLKNIKGCSCMKQKEKRNKKCHVSLQLSSSSPSSLATT